MKLTADQYYYVYFCMLEEPAMFKPLSYSSEFEQQGNLFEHAQDKTAWTHGNCVCLREI